MDFGPLYFTLVRWDRRQISPEEIRTHLFNRRGPVERRVGGRASPGSRPSSRKTVEFSKQHYSCRLQMKWRNLQSRFHQTRSSRSAGCRAETRTSQEGVPGAHSCPAILLLSTISVIDGKQMLIPAHLILFSTYLTGF